MNSNPLPVSPAEIEQRAHELWLSYGSPEGRDVEIWLAAENNLKSERRGRAGAAKMAKSSGRKAADDIDEQSLAERLSDFGELDRRSVSSAEPN